MTLAAPYVRADRTTASLMTTVCVALVPPSVAAVYVFGFAAAVRLIVGLLTAFVADRLSGIHRPFDGSAAVTGLILTLSCPVGTPLWLLALGSVFAVFVMRDAFGGIGNNLFNPAMAARAVMLTVFPTHLGGYTTPDALSTATPLSSAHATPTLDTLLPRLIGTTNGSLGETSALMILLGAIWLIARRVVRWQVPVLSLLGFSIVSLLTTGHLILPLLSGSILFGAVYIFTDYTGKPTTPFGEGLFAFGVGATAALLRIYGRYPEGVCFAILLWNLLTPLIEQLTAPHIYGRKKRV
ncbi:MAG: RnfABCDGE type electron transport complex subunit D [Clostridia bacterium]|nr:RnfABCDGE type electron transport complex subunit D [Clostridia bacterium]